MLELTTTRHNPLIDPSLHIWGWEIPVYLFLGGMVAGMMVFAGLAMLKTAKGEDTRNFFSLQTPLLAFVLLNLGMLALLLDLAHPLYVVGDLPHLHAAVADGLGLVGAADRVRDPAGVGADPAAGSLAVDRPDRAVHAARVGLVRGEPIPHDGAGLGQHRVRRRGRRLHRDPAEHDGRAPAVEHVGASRAVPGLRPVRGRRRAAPRGARVRQTARATGNDQRGVRRARPAAGRSRRRRTPPNRCSARTSACSPSN